MKPKTLIFDLDGTISDPFEGISKSVNFAIESLAFEPVDPEQIRSMIGPPLTEIFESLLGLPARENMDALVEKYRERYASIGFTENVIYADMAEVISALAESGYALGVCTSKRTDYAIKIVDMFGLGPYFHFVDGGDVGVHKHQQLERLVSAGIDAESTIMIGDRYVDIEAAKKNRMKSVGVAWGFGSADELQSAAPDYLLRSPRDILELFP